MTSEGPSKPIAKTPLPAVVHGRARLGPSEAAVYETFVVPRYMALFGDLALEMLVDSDDAQVVHLHCRTGYPDRGIAMRLRGAHLVGVDGSLAALELARTKAATMPEMVSQYRFVADFPTSLPSSAFSHALIMHALGMPDDRSAQLRECARLLAAHGQVIVTMPLRGSFQEIGDLLREYALKFDDGSIEQAVNQAELERPTIEGLGAELEQVGFDFVELEQRPTTVRFHRGRDFFEDPIARLVILPELRLELGLEGRPEPLSYVRDAIDTYWSDGNFELTVNVGCATGRKLA
jgi:SAM-dependent methyltransferase